MNGHDTYMRMAIELAKRAEGMTSPNPIVGAVIVRNDEIVGSGYHKKAGLPHAEVNALEEAGKAAKGACLYVTLEPCDHHGRTPPCTDAIIRSGIRRVYIGMVDPNPLNRGRGVKRLKKNGIETHVGILENEARLINLPYIKFITRGLPYVTVKLAQSLDGKIATRTGDSKWISGPDSRNLVHRLRERVDAVMVGVKTVLKDDPLLTARGVGANNKTRRPNRPLRVVVDSSLKTPLGARVFSSTERFPLLLATTRRAPPRKVRLCLEKGAEVLMAKAGKGGIDLKDLLEELAGRDITHVLVEGGGRLIGSLLEEGLVDRLLFFIAPKIIGGEEAVASVGGKGAALVRDALRLKDIKVKRLKKDLLVEAYL